MCLLLIWPHYYTCACFCPFFFCPQVREMHQVAAVGENGAPALQGLRDEGLQRGRARRMVSKGGGLSVHTGTMVCTLTARAVSCCGRTFSNACFTFFVSRIRPAPVWCVHQIVHACVRASYCMSLTPRFPSPLPSCPTPCRYQALRDDVEPDPVQRMQRERARLLQQKQQAGKKKQSVSEVHSLKSGKDSQRLEGRGLLELPPPVAKGTRM